MVSVCYSGPVSQTETKNRAEGQMKKQLHIRLSPELHDRLQLEAEMHETASMQTVIEGLLEMHLPTKEALLAEKEEMRQARKAYLERKAAIQGSRMRHPSMKTSQDFEDSQDISEDNTE